MSKIANIHAIEILDSRGIPTIEVILQTTDGIVSRAKVPSGASTGKREALELRDADFSRFHGKGVLKAIQNVKYHLNNLLKNESVLEQEKLDKKMIAADGTNNKAKFGANAILGVSMAIARAGAYVQKKPLYDYISKQTNFLLPCPMMNIINGGAHADNDLEIQEFMISPDGAPTIKEMIRWGAEIFQTLKKILKEKGLSTCVGDEGGFAPKLKTNEEALELIILAIEKSGYKAGQDVSIALDVASSEFYKNKRYGNRTTTEQIDYLERLCSKFPIESIEDGLAEDDWEGWILLTQRLGNKIQLVGDDIFVTNPKIFSKAIKDKIANSILIKLNQIGTVTETIETIKIAKANNYKIIVSHRSGETEDSFIADFAVAVNSGQIKTGSLSRSDRTAKYNRLLEIEDELSKI